MVRRTLPFSPIWGLIFRVMPTSLRSMVWNGLEELLLVVVYEPVTKGTFWPTTILASSLSSVITLAVDRMLVPDMVSRADAMVPNVSVLLLPVLALLPDVMLDEKPPELSCPVLPLLPP